jgi:hypothetical protein
MKNQPEKKNSDNNTKGNYSARKEKYRGTFIVNDVVCCRVEGSDGATLYNPDTDKIRKINPSGLEIWVFLKEPHTLDEITTYLLENFSDSPPKEMVIQDVTSFLENLISAGYLIEV